LISFIRRKDEIEMEGRPGIALIQTLRSYQPGWLSRDLSAGLAIAAVGLPSAIAYPAIAGLPPETGLYASILALVGYALFGPSQKLIMGPDAATMIVLAAVLAELPPGAIPERIVLASALALMVGFLCLLARLLRIDVVASFLSRPILTGFMTGISLSILIGQLGRLTGVKIEDCFGRSSNWPQKRHSFIGPPWRLASQCSCCFCSSSGYACQSRFQDL
jgi:sulfate permease, SulP family